MPISRKHREAWAQLIQEREKPKTERKLKKEEKRTPAPCRVLIPKITTGRSWDAVLKSLASQIKTEHLNLKGKMILTSEEIKIEWSDVS
jgi:hypothetical protein